MKLRTTKPLLALSLIALVAVACGERSADAPTPRHRVLMVGIDGASPLLVDPLLAAGRLPNLAELARRGAAGTIRSMVPIDSPRIWNTIATGKDPDKHGILRFAHKTASGDNTLYLSTDRKVHALWNIVSDAGMTVGVVNFWNTYPPELVQGVMVSDHLLARNIDGRRRITKAGEVSPGPVVYPETWSGRLSSRLEEPERLTRFENPLRMERGLPRYLVLVGDDLPRRFDEDGLLTRIALEIDEGIEPDLLMVLLPGIDRTSHFLWGSLQADQDVYDEELRLSRAEQQAGRAALETYYEYTDALIGRLVERFDDDDLVIVLSDHGFEVGRGMGLLTGIHEGEAALDGVFFAAGPGIAPGTVVKDLSVRDVTPSVLAWLGLPVGQDMDGRVAGFLRTQEVTHVASHDVGPVQRMSLRPSGAEDEIVDQLRSLGYLE
jgi:hypothetical protein